MAKQARLVSLALLLGLLASPAGAQAPDIGDRCQPGDPPPRPGIICRPAFEATETGPQAVWEFESGNVLNGRKGDAILTPGCGLIANLLRKVTPAQKYSHSGIFVQDRFRIRHSTAAEDRAADYGAGAPAGAEGILENVMKYGWPGTITQWSDEAMEGKYLGDPSGNAYYFRPFNKTAEQCQGQGDLVPPSLLKPFPEADYPGSEARTRLELGGDAALAIEGHYRFYGYTEPASVLYTPAFPSSPESAWAYGTVGSVCSAFVWRSLKDAGFTLEGPSLEPTDGFAVVDPATPDGMYVYDALERGQAAQFLYDEIYDHVHAQVGDFGDVFVDAADDVGNQLVNCFGFDWCGETFPPTASVCDFEPRAQDSPCWRQHPGTGHAVSPDDLMRWDAPPEGPYGYREDLVYQPAQWVRVYEWGPAEGTGTVEGVVRMDGAPVADALVVIEGLKALTSSGPGGFYRIEGVPAGPWMVRACYLGNGDAANFTSLDGGTVTQDLALGPGCDPEVDQGDWKRRVRIQGTVKLVDTESEGPDETQTFSLDETVDVELPTPSNPDAHAAEINWASGCVGGEVKGRIKFAVGLDQHDKSVSVLAVSRLYEGQSCDDNDLDATSSKIVSVPAGGSKPLFASFVSEEFLGNDKMVVNLTVTNQTSPE